MKMGRIEVLEEKIRGLEARLLKNEKIRRVLMDRVENSVNSSGSAYTLFESNITLQEKVAQRTEALQRVNKDLQIEIQNRKRVEKEKEKLIVELQQALAEVKVLSGMLPICSFCKNIRNDEGYWQEIEAYLREHSTAEFSHSVCKDCMKKYYPEIYQELKREGNKS
jgi:hypothetical protein